MLFAYLAAVYLTLEIDDLELREDLRKRVLGAAAAVGLMALVVYLLYPAPERLRSSAT
jgi:hypothetical protein